MLKPGDLSILPKGTTHRYCATENWSILWFHLNSWPGWRRLLRENCRVQSSGYYENLLRLGEDFLDEMTSGRPLAMQALESLAALILVFIKRELTDSPTPELIGKHRRIETVWQNIMEHPDKEWSIDLICSQSGFSRTRLHHFCKLAYGMTPGEKLMELRMERGRYYLQNTDWTLAEISERVGYETPFAFSRAFKRYTGVSPSQLPERIKV